MIPCISHLYLIFDTLSSFHTILCLTKIHGRRTCNPIDCSLISLIFTNTFRMCWRSLSHQTIYLGYLRAMNVYE